MAEAPPPPPIVVVSTAERVAPPLDDQVSTSIEDVGWHDDPEHMRPLIDGISNDDVFTLIRRLNKVVWYLKDTPSVPVGGLDLAVAAEQEFAPNKMRAQVERLYVSVVSAPPPYK
jgi:hypothetical protein